MLSIFILKNSLYTYYSRIRVFLYFLRCSFHQKRKFVNYEYQTTEEKNVEHFGPRTTYSWPPFFAIEHFF